MVFRVCSDEGSHTVFPLSSDTFEDERGCSHYHMGAIDVNWAAKDKVLQMAPLSVRWGLCYRALPFVGFCLDLALLSQKIPGGGQTHWLASGGRRSSRLRGVGKPIRSQHSHFRARKDSASAPLTSADIAGLLEVGRREGPLAAQCANDSSSSGPEMTL